ncbi:MAG: squalene--hopene cyclase [Planctomycetaceae bacterium]|nr:squalene--hopene cyclase [Planctomycetaceae bacterium]
MLRRSIATWLLYAILWCGHCAASEPVTAENYVAPEANSKDEPLAETYSLEAAARFLDAAAIDWTTKRTCFTCHTNYSYLMARPLISAAPSDKAPAHTFVRAALETIVVDRWEKRGPRWPTEVVASGAILAFNDAHTTGKLHPASKQALDRMWTVQRADGSWKWLNCDYPPMESDDHYGVTIAAVGVGVAPDGYAQSPAAQAGLAKIKSYLRENPGEHLHQRAMVLWASTYLPDLELQTAAESSKCIDELLSLQHSDGGWSTAALGKWQRADHTPQDTASSDGYGTGFVIYVLRRTGLPAEDPRLKKGIAWLKANQRASGRWFTRSLHQDSKHYLTHAGTAYACMALAACGETLGK